MSRGSIADEIDWHGGCSGGDRSGRSGRCVDVGHHASWVRGNLESRIMRERRTKSRTGVVLFVTGRLVDHEWIGREKVR